MLQPIRQSRGGAALRKVKGGFLLAVGRSRDAGKKGRRCLVGWVRRGVRAWPRVSGKAWQRILAASWEISWLEVAGLCVRGCQAGILPDVGRGAGLVRSEWLRKCQASQPRVAGEAWLPARPVHPVFVAGNKCPHSRCTSGKVAKAQGREGNVSSPAAVLLPPLSPPAAQPLRQDPAARACPELPETRGAVMLHV